MTLSKDNLLNSLPIRDGNLTIRAWMREDIERLADWPSYPPVYAPFNLAYRALSVADGERRFASRERDPARINLVTDLPNEASVAYVALVEIDWKAGCVGNMAFRVKPTQCDRGLGTRILRLVRRWCFEKGMTRLRLDVAAANPRAICCYEKAGFVVTGEFWRDDAGLQDVDLSRDEHALLRPHVRHNGLVPQVRFFWMESARGEDAHRDAQSNGGKRSRDD